MWDSLRAFFEDDMLNPHGICLLWRPELLWTHVVSDLLIGIAYFSIPLALGVFLYHRRDVRFGWAIWMFVAFIMLCGVTHFMMIWTMWNPDYGVEALIKAATATASVATAVALWPLLPKAIAIPSTDVLQARIAERDAAVTQLQAAMATMVRMEEHKSEQDRLLEEMNRSETRLRSIFENAAVGIGRVAVDGQFLEVNERYAEIAGWSREDLMAGGFQRITHPEDLDADLSQVEALLKGDGSRYSIEKRYVRSDGQSIWVRLTVSLVRDPSGEPEHFVAIVEDIHEDKLARESRDLLMREVDHRARNALSVVQSVVRLTNAPAADDFKKVLIGRVDALARAQASLARTNWHGAALADVVREELSATAASASQWTATGPSVELPPEHVQPLSMIVHELATNALKYGALSVPAGHVRVTWKRLQDSGWGLHWEESEGPPATAPDRTGFGSRLITRLATELQGGVEFRWKREGLEVHLTSTPAPNSNSQPHPFVGGLSRLRERIGPE